MGARPMYTPATPQCHILPGARDTCYDKTKVEFHREEYRKLDFPPSAEERGITDIRFASLLATGLGDAWKIVDEEAERIRHTT